MMSCTTIPFLLWVSCCCWIRFNIIHMCLLKYKWDLKSVFKYSTTCLEWMFPTEQMQEICLVHLSQWKLPCLSFPFGAKNMQCHASTCMPHAFLIPLWRNALVCPSLCLSLSLSLSVDPSATDTYFELKLSKHLSALFTHNHGQQEKKSTSVHSLQRRKTLKGAVRSVVDCSKHHCCI